jgi:hypothetical protein
VLVDVLRETGGTELQELAEAAATFLLEVLASFEMTRRGFFDSGAEAAGDPPPDLPR